MLQQQCLWAVTAPKIDPYEVLSSDAQTAVCIIGGGYTGLSAAIHLAEKCIKVVLLESHTIGSGGSGKSVGLVNAGTWARPDDLSVSLGKETGERLTEALGAAPSLVSISDTSSCVDAVPMLKYSLAVNLMNTAALPVSIKRYLITVLVLSTRSLTSEA